MSQGVPKQRKSKKDAAPPVILQEAIPVPSPDPIVETPMERLSSLNLSPETLPDGMKSESRHIAELEENRIRAAQAKLNETTRNEKFLKTVVLATGIGLGMLLCVKGYKWVFPALKQTTESIVEETVSE